MKTLLVILTILLPFTLCAQKGIKADRIPDFNEITVKEFLEMVQQFDKGDPKTREQPYIERAPVGWVTKEDVEQVLIPIIRSMQQCKCISSPFSSYGIPITEYSTLGGLAMDLIDSYRNKTEYPQRMWYCTKTDRNRADEMEKWWETEGKK